MKNTSAQKTVLLIMSALLFLSGVAGKAANGNIMDVKHVVVFMQENRSFDHYFGTLAGVNGYSDHFPFMFQNNATDFFQPNGGSYVLPYHANTQCLGDLDHSWTPTHNAWDGGKWDAWVPQKGAQTMLYYTRADLPYYYGLADGYTICDNYHCSVLGPTNPNRLYLFTGMIDPNGTGGGPVIDNTEPSKGFTWTTYAEMLQNAGVSWKVYQQTDNYDDNALAWFANFINAKPGNPLYDRGMVKSSDVVSEFQTDITNGTLPTVSWIIAPAASSEHPSYSPASGEALTK